MNTLEPANPIGPPWEIVALMATYTAEPPIAPFTVPGILIQPCLTINELCATPETIAGVWKLAGRLNPNHPLTDHVAAAFDMAFRISKAIDRAPVHFIRPLQQFL